MLRRLIPKGKEELKKLIELKEKNTGEKCENL